MNLSVVSIPVVSAAVWTFSLFFPRWLQKKKEKVGQLINTATSLRLMKAMIDVPAKNWWESRHKGFFNLTTHMASESPDRCRLWLPPSKAEREGRRYHTGRPGPQTPCRDRPRLVNMNSSLLISFSFKRKMDVLYVFQGDMLFQLLLTKTTDFFDHFNPF